MAHGYKIDVTEYLFGSTQEVLDKTGKFVMDPETGEPKLETKQIKIAPKIHLPLMLCNPNLADQEKRNSFDLFELGRIAKQIELSDTHVVLVEADFNTLKERMSVIQKFLNYRYYEMVRRIHEAEKIELKEA